MIESEATSWHRTILPTAVSNTTHGSGWIVQVRPTEGGLSPASPNTTHGSGWIVQVRPTGRAARSFCFLLSLSSRREWRKGEEKWDSRVRPCVGLYLNNPPTAVGGIPG